MKKAQKEEEEEKKENILVVLNSLAAKITTGKTRCARGHKRSVRPAKRPKGKEKLR